MTPAEIACELALKHGLRSGDFPSRWAGELEAAIAEAIAAERKRAIAILGGYHDGYRVNESGCALGLAMDKIESGAAE